MTDKPRTLHQQEADALTRIFATADGKYLKSYLKDVLAIVLVPTAPTRTLRELNGQRRLAQHLLTFDKLPDKDVPDAPGTSPRKSRTSIRRNA